MFTKRFVLVALDIYFVFDCNSHTDPAITLLPFPRCDNRVGPKIKSNLGGSTLKCVSKKCFVSMFACCFHYRVCCGIPLFVKMVKCVGSLICFRSAITKTKLVFAIVPFRDLEFRGTSSSGWMSASW